MIHQMLVCSHREVRYVASLDVGAVEEVVGQPEQQLDCLSRRCRGFRVSRPASRIP
jgi:hypothetical protein